MIRSDDPMRDPNTPDGEMTVADWERVHLSGEDHDAGLCPWCCGDMEEAAAAEAAAPKPKVPPEEWQMFPAMDWAEYLAGDPPLYLADDEKTVLGVGGKKVGTLNEDGSVDWEAGEK